MEASLSEKSKAANMAQPAAIALTLPVKWVNFVNNKFLFQKFGLKLMPRRKRGPWILLVT